MASYTAVLLSPDGVTELVIPEPVPYVFVHKHRRLIDTFNPNRMPANRLPPRREYVRDFRRLSVYPRPGELVFYEEV